MLRTANSLSLFSGTLLWVAAGAVAHGATPCRATDDAVAAPRVALQRVADGLRQPVHVVGRRGRLYVVEQAGRIRVIDHGKVLAHPFLDVRAQVESGGEMGLLSMAFDPNYAKNGYFYVNYTTERDGLRSVVARFRARDAEHAERSSELPILTLAQPFRNHNGGQLAFGPDRMLYIGFGDGGAANDPYGHGQNPGTLLGSILRIDVSAGEDGNRYRIPADNPFVGRDGARPEIWAYGLRNPWRFAFDALNGRLFAGDVGQDAVEEIDIIRRGLNYGWNIMEGDRCTPGVARECDPRGLTAPLFTYPHPVGFSVTGGMVYRGAALPALCGVYVYADYVTRRMWGLRLDGDKVGAHWELLAGREDAPAISSFGEDEDFELYVADHRGGAIFKLVPSSAEARVSTNSPDPAGAPSAPAHSP